MIISIRKLKFALHLYLIKKPFSFQVCTIKISLICNSGLLENKIGHKYYRGIVLRWFLISEALIHNQSYLYFNIL